MSRSDMEKLRILLKHWIEHNQEHGEEFREWAEKANGIGEVAVHRDMLVAAQHMDEAGESLLKALEEIGEGKA